MPSEYVESNEGAVDHGLDHAGDPESASETLTLTTTERDGAQVLRAVGEIDTTSAPALRGALLPALAESELVVLDLTEVSFLGSSGLAVLVEAREHPEPGTDRLRLVCTNRIVLRALEATGLRELFHVSPDLTTALRR